MKRPPLSGNLAVWAAGEACVMWFVAFLTLRLIEAAGAVQVGKAIASATVLLSVVMAIVIQLWVKLNDLSSLASLEEKERARLSATVTERSRALIILVIFFLLFIFFLLSVSAISAGERNAEPLLSGVGAGIGACVVLIAAMLVDLNEIAQFRWKVELIDSSAKRKAQALQELRDSEAGFENDPHIQGYKRIESP